MLEHRRIWFKSGLPVPRINWSHPLSRRIEQARNYCFRKWLQDMRKRYIVSGPNMGDRK